MNTSVHQAIQKSLDQVDAHFLRNNLTLGFAESCTGGLLSATLASRPGVSKFFLGSVVAYDNKIKQEFLDVPGELISTMGAVSAAVALKMAQGARSRLHVDWSVSVTGIAGPSGGSAEKPVGTVFFAVCGPGLERVEEKRFKEKERQEIQLRSVEYALELLLDCLLGESRPQRS